ncbi:hypothetical protein Rsub_13323 [Raphidocelis subcapitata]|uniref:Vesicle transport protein n=1 Tax=Raphidocelis subcapitata TaxID=307507 RepID=A0A2V0PLD8_9CHLO|nr:hypothetical protein Rsub_13323 [Raphidocelis subcapitata]|eukprot:GBG00592.1 hypothetical protein Rsub_13323 [Raphidocelis subcapitata]
MFSKLGAKLGLASAPAEPPGLPQQLVASATAALEDATPTLSWRQRAIGFGVCFGVGMLFSFLSLISLWTFQLTGFAVLYSLGAILSLASTAFLMGPCRQLKSMMQSGRWIATTVYLAAIVGTLAVAFNVKGALGALLVLVLLVIQLAAFVWYALTYVPGGTAFLGRMVGIK